VLDILKEKEKRLNFLFIIYMHIISLYYGGMESLLIM